MAISAVALTSGSNVSGATTATTASITPTANRLILAAVAATQFGSDITPSVASSGLTWVQVLHRGYTASNHSFTLFRAMGASPGAGAATITFGGAMDNIVWSIVEVDGVVTTGSAGDTAIVQSNSSVSTTGTTALTGLAAFGSTSNGVYAAISGADPNSLSAGSGFTQLHAQQGLYLDVASQWRADNDTTVDCIFDQACAWAIIAVELAASAASATGPFIGSFSLLGVGL